jgi:two-component system NtrC family sensor kinase
VQIGEQIKRAGSVTRRLLHWARDMDRPTDVLDVNKLLTRTIYLLENDLAAGNVRIVRRFEPDLPMAVGDEPEIIQVFLHLMKNALDAMKGTGGTLTMTTALRDGLIVIQVADTGPGIPPELVERIFEPFFTTKPAGEGTGLGLAISAWIVQRAGGQIAVDSVPGKGATFTVTLQPASLPPTRGGTDESRAAAARR